MFPLVHYFVNRQIYGSVPTLMALGGIFPDLAAGAGMNRDKAHEMGANFHTWCKNNAQKEYLCLLVSHPMVSILMELIISLMNSGQGIKKAGAFSKGNHIWIWLQLLPIYRLILFGGNLIIL